MKILVTGGCGFVGSNICNQLISYFDNCKIIAFDNLKRRGSELNISRLTGAGVDFVHGDVRNEDDFANLPIVDYVIDASAEPSVLAGIESSPNYLVHTNFIGTLNCLNFARKTNAKFIFLSTSRVYSIPSLETIGYTEGKTRFKLSSEQSVKGIDVNGVSENFPTSGYRSLYGSTKLSSELLIEEYHHLFGLNTIINRCAVLTGPYQMGKVDQGVVVLWMARHFWSQKLKYIGFGGSGKQVRDILHINDLVSLLKIQIENFDQSNGEIYNVGGGKELSVSLLELTAFCEELTGNKISVVGDIQNRVADIPIYITNNNKVSKRTGWKPMYDTLEILTDIYNWIKVEETNLKPILG